MSDYIYDRAAVIAHATEQAKRLVQMNPLMADLKERFGLEIDPDGHFETWKMQGGLAGLGTHQTYKTLLNDELIERHKEAQDIVKEVRRKRGKAAGDIKVVE